MHAVLFMSLFFFDTIKPIMESKNFYIPYGYSFFDLQMPALTSVKKLAGRTLSYEKFEKIIERLFSSGFFNVNGAINVLADYTGYKAYYQIEEFENPNGHKVVLEFIKEFVNGETYYHIKEVTVE